MWLRIRTFIWDSVLDGFHDAVKRSVISVVTTLGIVGSMTSFYHDNGMGINVLMTLAIGVGLWGGLLLLGRFFPLPPKPFRALRLSAVPSDIWPTDAFHEESAGIIFQCELEVQNVGTLSATSIQVQAIDTDTEPAGIKLGKTPVDLLPSSGHDRKLKPRDKMRFGLLENPSVTRPFGKTTVTGHIGGVRVFLLADYSYKLRIRLSADDLEERIVDYGLNFVSERGLYAFTLKPIS